jgi:hypothetical protein
MQPLDILLSKANRVDAIVVIGRTLHEHKLDSISKFNRAIFPNPECQSILHYAKTVHEFGHIRRNIAEATNTLSSQRVKVRWYPHAIHHAILLADTERSSGWVQVESVLPFSIPNLRPGWRAYRSHQEQLVISISHIFEKMWEESAEPSKAVIKRLMSDKG